MIKKVVAGIATAGIAFTAIPPVVQDQHHEDHGVIDLHAGHNHSDEELDFMAANGMSDPVNQEMISRPVYKPCSTVTWHFDRSGEVPYSRLNADKTGMDYFPKDAVIQDVREALAYMSAETGLSFAESPTFVSGDQTLRIFWQDLPGTIWGLGGGTQGYGSKVVLDTSVEGNTYTQIVKGEYRPSGITQALVIHEVMHAMGFGHQKSQSSIMYRNIGFRKDLGDIDKGLLAKHYPRTNCPAPAPEPQPEAAPTPPPPPPVREDRTGWLMRDTVSPNLLTKGKAKSFKFEDGYYKDNMTGSNWTVKKKNKITLDCTIPEGTPKGNRKGCYSDHTLYVFELKGPKKGKQIDIGKTVTVPKDKGKYIVVVAPEEPTKQQKNKGRIVWMVKQ